MGNGKIKNLIGQRFHYLTVIKRAEDYISPKGEHKARWLCRCDCGNKVLETSNQLTRNKVKSCGCIKSNSISKANKKYNTYDLSNEHGVGYTNKGEEFWFDLEDYDLIKDYCWFINSNGYVVDGQSNLLHRIIMKAKIEDIVDHKKHKLFDNRKSQLRIINKSKNMMNSYMPSDNTSGYKGVCWDKRSEKYMAYIKLNNKFINLGYFKNIQDAVKERERAENKYFNEWSLKSSMNEGV